MTAMPPDPPWLDLAMTAALPQDRPLLAMLLEFDRRLDKIATQSSEPMLGQIRLAWWRDVLTADTPPSGEPLIATIMALESSVAWNLRGAMLQLVDGWEVRLLSPDDVTEFAKARGEGLFRAFSGPGSYAAFETAAASWAMADRTDIALSAIRAPRLEGKRMRQWPRRLRPLSLLALAGQANGRAAGLRLSWHGLTGR